MKKVLSVALALALLASLACVGALADETNGLKRFEETQTIRVYTNNAAQVDPNNALTPLDQFILDNCNIRVAYELVGWDDRVTKLIADVAAGNAPDVFSMGSADEFPLLITRGLLAPLDDYLDLTDEIYHPSITEYYSWMGKHYGVRAAQSNGAFVILYNTALFENNGVKTPLEYYNEGNWNWDTFMECARAMTQDTDGDGAIDQWGYHSYMQVEWIAANGGHIINFDRETGDIKLGWEDEASVKGLQFAIDLYNVGGVASAPMNNGWEANFQNGLISMIGGQDSYIQNFRNSMGAEAVGFVSFPCGPDNKDGVLPGVLTFYGVGAGSKNMEAAAEYIHAATVFQATEGMERSMNNKQLTEEERVLFTTAIISNNVPVYPFIDYAGVGGMAAHKWDIHSQIAWSPSSANNVISTYTALYESEIAAELEYIKEWTAQQNAK